MQATIPFALGRIAFGAALIAAPKRVAAGWLPGDAARPGTQVAVRGLGARDVALAAGVVAAKHKRPWLIACLACDLADIAATLAAGEVLPAVHAGGRSHWPGRPPRWGPPIARTDA